MKSFEHLNCLHYHESSNINEFTRAILNYFIQKLHNHKKSTKRLQANKNRKMLLKNS